MAQKPASSLMQNTGLLLVLTYFVLLLINGVVLYLANSFFPTQIVLGTLNMSPLWAILHSMGVLSLLGTFAIPFAREIEQRRGRMLSSIEWMVGYFALNFVGLWLLARYNDGFALGLSAWYIAAALALVLDVIQGIAMMQLEKFRRG